MTAASDTSSIQHVRTEKYRYKYQRQFSVAFTDEIEVRLHVKVYGSNSTIITTQCGERLFSQTHPTDVVLAMAVKSALKAVGYWHSMATRQTVIQRDSPARHCNDNNLSCYMLLS